MNWKKRTRMSLAAVSLSATLLAACSAGGNPDAASRALETPSDPVSLRMTVWTSNKDHLALFNEIGKAYVAENPDLISDVSFEALPFEDYSTTLTTQIAGGNPPDLAWVFESNAPEFVASGALLDVAPALKAKDGYQYDDLMDSSLTLWKKDDGLFAYPFSNSPFVMFVNTDRIKEAGVQNPVDLKKEDWTYDKVLEIAKASADKLGGQGFVVRDFDFKMWSNLEPVLFAFGAEPWSQDGTKCAFNSSEMVTGMQWLHDAAFKDGAMPTPGITGDFFAGDVTLTITQISRAASADGSFKWDVVSLPSGPVGRVGVVGQAGIGVLAKAEHPKIAADFLAYFTSPENAKKLAAYFPPPRKSLVTVDVLKQANPSLTKKQLQVVVDGIVGARAKAAHENYAQLDTTVRAELDALWTKDADIKSVLDKTCTAIEPLLQK